MKYVFAVISCLLGAAPVTNAQDSVSSSERGRLFAMEFGAGMGGYYGTLGTRFSISRDLLGADFGLGFGPLAEGATLDISAGLSLYFKDRTTPLRPKVSLFYSRIGYTLNVMEEVSVEVSGIQTTSTNVLYQENFQCIELLAGLDWSLGKSGKLCLNFDLGYRYPFAGYEEVRQTKDEKVAEYRSMGYTVSDSFGNDKVTWFDYVDLSVGIGFALGRR